MSQLHVPKNPVRLVTASSLFDGHDASINIMRRIFMSQGCEVVHLGHNRSVQEVVDAAIEEDVQGIAVSSYQGGHIEYFEYLVESLRERGADHVHVVGGGGGVIVHDEIDRLRSSGVTIFSPEDGQRLGLPGMINSVVEDLDFDLWEKKPVTADEVISGDRVAIARAITGVEEGKLPQDALDALAQAAAKHQVPVLGITGTGGSGKSSLTDELVRRLRIDQQDKLRVAVIAVDPTRRKGGGALLGDRIRMNSLDGDRTYFRSLATRGAHELPDYLGDVITVLKAAGFDLVVVETPGIGQGDAAVVPYVDTSLYVMTPEFGAASQLKKIDMLDFADVVAINKFERRGAEDAMRDVGRQLVRNREAFGKTPEDMPVFGTSAATFNDDGVTALYQYLTGLLGPQGLHLEDGALPHVDVRHSSKLRQVVPSDRVRYLSEITETVRDYHARTAMLAHAAQRLQRVQWTADELASAGATGRCSAHGRSTRAAGHGPQAGSPGARGPDRRLALRRPGVRRPPRPRVAVRQPDPAGLAAGVHRPRRAGEVLAPREPARPLPVHRRGLRVQAGERGPGPDVRRRGRPGAHQPPVQGPVRGAARRPALDGLRLGHALRPRPRRATRHLRQGRHLRRQRRDARRHEGALRRVRPARPDDLGEHDDQRARADRARVLPQHRDGPGSRARLDPEEALRTVRGTVQADILKEDQGQNTCLFSTEFSLRCMADIQEWFIEKEIRNFYSVSISGYHIAEAGANPISQLAFTLANGFTYVEAYLARGMDIDDFAPNLSFFFSNGMDPEYSVIGRVARRIWAVAMKEKYGAGERSQKLKYHVQTSGRSLHAQEMDFNDIRTTLQALIAIYDNANSLHTNAFDEAVTTPSTESVRRALAIQLIISREWGLAMNENPLQGSYVIDELTDLVEEAVLKEFDAINERGGVLGAMETGYQRGRIQDESMLYEHRKHDGSLPIIGVNTFRRPGGDDGTPDHVELARATDSEKESQLHRVHAFQKEHEQDATEAIARLKEVAISDGNVFAALMDAARVCTLGQVTEAFFEVGGQYRRNV